MKDEQAKKLAELANERIKSARVFLRYRIITPTEYVDKIDAIRAEYGLDPLPQDIRKQAIADASEAFFLGKDGGIFG